MDETTNRDTTAGGGTVVRRTVVLDLTPEALWDLIGDGSGWSTWLVDEAAVVVEPGATGSVVDDAEPWIVRVDEVDDGHSVRFDWWPAGAPGRASTVTLEIEAPVAGGATTLHIVEVFPPLSQRSAARASAAWEVRAVAAWLSCRTPAYM